MSFLSQLFRSLKKSIAPSVGDTNTQMVLPLARFLRHSKDFSKSASIVKQTAFIPGNEGRLSVFRIDGLMLGDIEALGKQHISKFYGWAQLKTADVEKTSLKIDFNNQPERHADLVNWPPDKEERKSIALELATASTLVLCSQ